MEFPNEGCQEAFRCGQEFYLSGAHAKQVPEALTVCETHQEKLYFLLGIIMEVIDEEDNAAA